MLIGEFLAVADSQRATRTLQELFRHDLSGFALTGGFAIEMQIHARGGQMLLRPLHDIDFLVDSFEDVQTALGEELVLRHVHPHDPPGKTLLQGVHRTTSVRVDIFRAYGCEMERAELKVIDGVELRVVCFEDLAARHARLCWDLVEEKTLAPKYARDFLRMLEAAATEQATGAVEAVWREHRRPGFPATFAEATRRIRHAIANRRELLIEPVYSTDAEEVCTRCKATQSFPLFPPQQMLTRLGYC